MTNTQAIKALTDEIVALRAEIQALRLRPVAAPYITYYPYNPQPYYYTPPTYYGTVTPSWTGGTGSQCLKANA